ncbi:MAG: hypothetical protein RL757_452 [Bacteroidota bacterium]|jgi:glutathionylspermidine synthase
MKKIKVSPVPKRVFEDLGWDYFVSEEAKDYLTTEMMVISEAEGEALYTAANDVYDKLMHAAQFALDNNLLGTLGIPRNLHELVRLTWEDEKHLHLFSRFDFAGGLNGQPIKLLEINANTPTMMPETAIIQWAQLKANGIEETRQFNFFFESLVEQFEELRSLNPDKDATLLVSTLRDSEEDEANMSLLSKAAEEAGFEVEFKYIDEVIFSATEGIWAQGNQNIRTRYDFWLQLVPWEFIAEDEPDLTHLLTQIVKNDLAVILNPAWTMLLQSKGIMKIAWDLFKNHPNLLETRFDIPLDERRYVKKTMLGREGANVAIFDGWGKLEEERGGDYAHYPAVYQTYATLAADETYHYQAGVFYVGEACGLGFRRAPSKIIDNAAQFVGHVFE